jgi:hypothetical protein
MERGFSVRNHGLSWITSRKIKQFALLDKDLNEAGMRQFLPAKAAFDLSYHCPDCKIYIVDYAQSLSKEEANALAQSS